MNTEKLVTEILNKWHSSMTQVAMQRLDQEYIDHLKKHSKFMRQMADELVEILNKYIDSKGVTVSGSLWNQPEYMLTIRGLVKDYKMYYQGVLAGERPLLQKEYAVNDKLMCKVNIRPEYKGRKAITSLSILNNRIYGLRVLWKMDEDEKYPGEYALCPINEEDRTEWLKQDIGWIASGDVEVLKRGTMLEMKGKFSNIETFNEALSREEVNKRYSRDITEGIIMTPWPDKSEDYMEAMKKEEGTAIEEVPPIAKIVGEPTDKHLSGYLISPVKEGFETVIFSGISFAVYNRILTKEEIMKILDGWKDMREMGLLDWGLDVQGKDNGKIFTFRGEEQ